MNLLSNNAVSATAEKKPRKQMMLWWKVCRCFRLFVVQLPFWRARFPNYPSTRDESRPYHHHISLALCLWFFLFLLAFISVAFATFVGAVAFLFGLPYELPSFFLVELGNLVGNEWRGPLVVQHDSHIKGMYASLFHRQINLCLVFLIYFSCSISRSHHFLCYFA